MHEDNLEEDNANWKCVTWSDEMEIDLFGNEDAAYMYMYVWGKTNWRGI